MSTILHVAHVEIHKYYIFLFFMTIEMNNFSRLVKKRKAWTRLSFVGNWLTVI